MTANLYFIKCLTNLHVGSGDVNFNIIDNEVEKDSVTGYPTINASGVKGALRQFFEENAAQDTERLFGAAVKSSQRDRTGSTPGSLKFLAASLLARPVRASEGEKAYYMATTKTALEQLRCTVRALTGNTIFEITAPDTDCRLSDNACSVEGYEVKEKNNLSDGKNKASCDYLKGCIGEDFLILSDETLRKLPLPVLARNYLENGESKNLWYEELVPHESVFWFMVLGSNEDVSQFDCAVNGKVIQFGGNASVGCGLCSVKRGGVSDVEAAN